MFKLEIQTKLFEVVKALDDLNRSNFFNHLLKTSNIFSDYEFTISLEIQSDKKTNIPIDFIEGVEPFTIPITNHEQISDSNNKLEIALINNKGFSLFPGSFFESGEGVIIKEQYDKFEEENYQKHIDSIRKEMIQWDKEKKENYLKELLAELDEIDNNKKDKGQKIIDNSELLELDDPSKFYLYNELIVDLYTGGFWEDIVDAEWDVARSNIYKDDDGATSFPSAESFYKICENSEFMHISKSSGTSIHNYPAPQYNFIRHLISKSSGT